jgi:hypothetical protein
MTYSRDVHLDLALEAFDRKLECLGLSFEFDPFVDYELGESLHEVFYITLEVEEVLRRLRRVFVVFVLNAGSAYVVGPQRVKLTTNDLSSTMQSRRSWLVSMLSTMSRKTWSNPVRDVIHRGLLQVQ